MPGKKIEVGRVDRIGSDPLIRPDLNRRKIEVGPVDRR